MAGDPAALRSEHPTIAPEVLEAWRNAPPHTVAEIVDGTLSLLPRPRPRHAKTTFALSRQLGCFGDPDEGEPGGWVVLIEPELHLGTRPDVVVPDLAAWHRDRMPTEPEGAAISLVPDWVCEVLSESTEALDRGRKRHIYQREGVGHFWLVDPRVRILEVYRLDNGRWVELDTYEGDTAVHAPPFAAVAIDLARLWRW
jgi:Uma2 family endonuclease